MQSYLQRIADRSVGMMIVGNDPVSYVLPDNQPGTGVMQTDFIEETVIKTGSATNQDEIDPPSSINLKATDSASVTTKKNELQPNQVDEKAAVVTNNQDQDKHSMVEENREFGKQNPQQFPEAYSVHPKLDPTRNFISFSEKISKRNNANSTDISKAKSGVLTELNQEKQPEYVDLNKIMPVVKSNLDEGIVTEKRTERTDFPEKKTGPERLIPDTIVELIPSDHSPASSSAPPKDQSAPRLIIGRITVEVFPPAQPPVKTKEPPRRQTAASRPTGNERSGINKLSFGLGQL